MSELLITRKYFPRHQYRMAWRSKRGRGRKRGMGKKLRRGKKGAIAFKGDTKRFKSQGWQCGISTEGGKVATTTNYGLLSVGPVFAGVFNNTKEFVGSFAFRFDQLILSQKLNTLFDRYKINGVRVKFMPRFNAGVYGQGVGAPQIRLIHDYDDSSTTATPASIWARLGKTYTLDKPISIYVRPKTRTIVYGGVDATKNMVMAYSSKAIGYIDMVNQTVPYFGLKFAMRDVPDGWTCRIETTYYVSVKNQINMSAIDDALLKDREGEFEVNDDNELGYDISGGLVYGPTGPER